MGDLLHQLVHGLCTLYLKIHCKFHANICFLFYHTGVHCHFRDVVCKLILQYLQYFAFIIYMQDCMTIAWKCISEITINTGKNLPNTPCLFTNNLQKQRFGMMNDVRESWSWKPIHIMQWFDLLNKYFKRHFDTHLI